MRAKATLIAAASFWLTLVGFGIAAAGVDVEIGVDPTVATYGDVVSIFACVENLGDEAEVAAVDVTISYAGDPIFNASGDLPLPAGEELCGEAAFMVSPIMDPGIYTLTVTVTVSDGSDTAEASLEVTGSKAAGGGEGGDIIGDALSGTVGLSSTPGLSDEAQWGDIKELFK